jgi:hypothetical protein
MVDLILERNRHLGKMAWCEYAEAYMLNLPLIATRWERPAGSVLLDL